MMALSNSDLQKPNVYDRFSPFADFIKKESSLLFNEIRENLLQNEFESQFSIWSDELKTFIKCYEFSFTKIDHLTLINIYLSVLSNTNLNYQYVKISFDMLCELLRKPRLITRYDLTIDWRILYHWVKLLHNDHEENYGLVIQPENIHSSLRQCASICSQYYSQTSTEEILNELRPQMCLPLSKFLRTIKMFGLLLPVNLPSKFHNQGFQLWLNEFFDIWQNVYNNTQWEKYIITLFTRLAWNNIGYIDWESWLPAIFTRILRNFSLPIGTMEVLPLQETYFEMNAAKWIVAMIGNGSSCLNYLRDLLLSMKTFYHPSNEDESQENPINFLHDLAYYFVQRVRLERSVHSIWSFTPKISHRLTEQDITDFVNCIKDYVLISMFNEKYSEYIPTTCQYLSILRSELIVPVIIEKHFSSINSLTEPHRYIAIMNCLCKIARQIVLQTPLHIIPLLLSVLPGIDLNDIEKTTITLQFLNTILMIITCVDCSSAVDTQNDIFLHIEKEICLSTCKFSNFINEFLNRIFHMIDILSPNVSDGIEMNIDNDMLDINIQLKLTSIIFNIVQQCSEKIFELIREKIMFFITGAYLSPKIRPTVCCIIQGLVKGNPIETLKSFLPKTCKSIKQIVLCDGDGKENIELTWYLSLFSELVRARGDILVNYKPIIMSVFHHLIHITDKNTYTIIANAITNLLQSLCQVYSIDYRLSVNNDNLQIRTWGQSVDFDKLQVQFHIPNKDELDFVSDFLNTFIYPELNLLNEKGVVMSNNERFRSLTIIQSIVVGCFRVIPSIESEIIPSNIPYASKYQTEYPICKLNENLRMRLLIDIEKLLDQLQANQSDDVQSIKIALHIYQLIPLYHGTYAFVYKNAREDLSAEEDLLENRFVCQGQPIRSLIIRRMELNIQQKEIYHSKLMTNISKQVLLKLFELSINQYSAIRRESQHFLFYALSVYENAYEFLIDPIIKILDSSTDKVNYDQIKGCLHILLKNDNFFLLTKSSWQMKEKLWPLIARMPHANKKSIADLYINICEQIKENFITESIVHSENDIQSYKNLMETLSRLLENGTWTQQEITMSLLCLLLQKNVPIPLLAVKVFVDCLVHDKIELRQFAIKAVAALCRLQKPARIYTEKYIDNISDYEPVKTQNEWEERCFLDKIYYGYYTWPKSIKYTLNKRIRYTENNMSEQVIIIYNRFMDKTFLVQTIQLMILNYEKEENNEKKTIDLTRFEMFKGLFRNFGLAFFDNFMEQLYILIHESDKNKQEGCHQIAAEIVTGMIRGSKHWTLEMLDLFWKNLEPFLTEVCNSLNITILDYWEQCFDYSLVGDPRRMTRLINFLRTLINNKTTTNTFNKTAYWSLISCINSFNWRIPSLWSEFIEHAKLLLDHSSQNVREKIADVLAIAFSYDIELPEKKLTHHQPNINQFMNEICEQFQQGKQNLNFIKTIIHMHTQFYYWCDQPIKYGIIQLFPYLCEFESMEVNDETLKTNLKNSRLKVGLSYLTREYMDALVEQLLKVCQNSKWHVRRAVIEFIQYMVFCNLFNARSHTEQLHKLVIQCLFDEQYEVRITASETLSGLYQCGYLQVTDEDLNHFRTMSQTDYSRYPIQRHGGVLGFCSIVLSNPYDIPTYLPNILMFLCEHSHDSDLIQKSVKTCLSEFRRTHYDSWHEHRHQFTEEQLIILTDRSISQRYYA